MKFSSLHSLSALSLLALTLSVGCGQASTSSSSSSNEHTGSTSQALSTGLVISAIYGGSNNAASAYKHDYVELFNRGATPVVLTGKSLQYSTTRVSDTDATLNWKVATLPTATIDPGKYYLIRVFIQPSDGGTLPGEDLPTVDFDATGGTAGAPPGVNYGTNSGLVALVNGTTALTCQNPDAGMGSCGDATLIDFVGYGVGATPSGATAPPRLFEGTAGAPAPLSNAKGVFRKDGGCTETDDNAADFEILTYSTTVFARNSTSDAHVCGLDGGIPDAAVDVAVDTGLIDTGTTPTDGGADATDTGTTPTDGGTDASDTGTTPTDGGADATDGGADASDTGTTPEDTGTEPEDTGTEPADTGTNPQADTGTDQDAGTPTEEVVEDDGCGCRVAGSSHESSMAGGLAALALAGVLARRRRR